MAYNPNNPNGSATSANSAPVVIASDQSAIPVDINDGTGHAINSLLSATNANGIMNVPTGVNFVSGLGNTSVAQLAAGSTFTGTIESVLSQIALSLLINSDQSLTITVNQYITSSTSTLTSSYVYYTLANTGFNESVIINGNYVNITVKNTGAATTTTLNINSYYGTIPAATQYGNSPISINEINGTPITNPNFGLPVALSYENVDGFDQVVIAERTAQIEMGFMGAGTVTTLMNQTTLSGGATATWTAGQLTVTTTTTNPSVALLSSIQTGTYRAGYEMFSYFTAYWSGASAVAGTYSRIGYTDASTNGVWIGYEAGVMSISKMSGGTIVSIARSAWNGDLLTGLSNSKFTQLGLPVAINFAYLNVFRIRFGWLGAASLVFEVLSPDGNWIIFHTIYEPNSQIAPSIQNPNLPMSIWINSLGTTAQTIGTSCMVSGSSSPRMAKGSQAALFLPVQDAKDSGRTYVTLFADVIAGVTTEALASVSINIGGSVTSGTSYTVPAGKILRLTAINVTVKSTTTTAITGRVRVRSAATVAATSGVVMNVDVPNMTGTFAIGVGTNVAYSVPDGIEIAAGQQVGISQTMSSTSSTVSCFVTGFLY